MVTLAVAPVALLNFLSVRAQLRLGQILPGCCVVCAWAFWARGQRADAEATANAARTARFGFKHVGSAFLLPGVSEKASEWVSGNATGSASNSLTHPPTYPLTHPPL